MEQDRAARRALIQMIDDTHSIDKEPPCTFVPVICVNIIATVTNKVLAYIQHSAQCVSYFITFVISRVKPLKLPSNVVLLWSVSRSFTAPVIQPQPQTT